MAQPQLPLKDASRTVLRDFVDGKAEEFRDVLKIRIKDKTGLTGVAEKIGKVLWSDRKIFDVDTGVIAIVEDIDIGPSSRRVLILNNGFRSEGAVPAAKAVPKGVTISPRDFTPLGPFEEIRNGQKINYLKTDEGVRIEFEKTTITRIVGPDGVEIPISKFKGFEIGPNVHHAEMRALDWAKRNNCRIVAMAPTRGCCAHCLSRLQEYFGKDFDDAIAKHRQTRSAWRSFLKNLPKPTAQLQRTPALTTGGKTEFVVRKDAVDLARLRSQSSGLMAKAAAPNPKLVRIAGFLKVAGPVMMAFDAATSYAKASDQWNKGQKDAAADTVAEFGGRVAGAFVGAEALGLAFGGVGSVIPGLGTTVGALAGAVIGGAIGAYLGEQEAKQLCHQIMAWAKGSHPEPQAAQSRDKAAVPPTVSSDPAVEELQSQMYQTGFTRPEIDMIGKIVNEHNRARPWSTVRSPKEIFEQLGAGIIDARSVSEPIAYVASYPFTDVDRASSARTQIRGHGQSETGHLRTSAHEAPPLHGREGHPNEPSHKPGPWGPRPSEPRVTREVTGTVLTPLSGTDQRRNAASGEQDSQIADLSGRVDNLRQRLKDYDGLATGPADFNSASQLEADLGELRTIREQLLFLDASAIERHTVSRNLDEVRNRLEDTAEMARKAEDQRDNLAKARADEDRARQLDDLQKRNQDERNETQNDRIRFGQERRAEMQSLQELQDRKLKDAERDRVEDEQSRQARQERQVAEDRRKRDEEERRAPARNGRPPDDTERPRHDQAQAKTENDGRDVRPRDDAPKQQDKEDARRRDDDRISSGGEEIGRKREDAVQNRTEEGPRKRDDALSKQNDAGARDREDVIRKQKDDDERRDHAARKQKDDDDRRDHAIPKQKEDDERRDHATRKQKDDDERRDHAIPKQKEDRDHAIRKQKDDDERRDHATRKQKEDDERRDHAIRKQKEDDERRDHVTRKQKEDDERRDHAIRKQKEDDERRDHAIRKQKEDDDRRDHAARKQKEDDERRDHAIRKQKEDDERRDHAIRKQKEDDERRDHAIPKRNEDDARRREEGKGSEREQHRQGRPQGRDDRYGKAENDRDWKALQDEKDKQRREQEAKAKRHARDDERARKDWDRKRDQETRQRQHHDEQQKRRAERERNEKQRELRERAIEEERQRKKWEWQRQEKDKERRRLEREAEERRRSDERARAQQERDRKQADWERRKLEKQQEQEAHRRREYQVIQRTREDERRRKHEERQRQHEQNEHRRQQKQAERDQIKRQKQADWERRKWEKQQEQHARRGDAQRNRSWYSTSVTGRIKKW